MTQLANIVKCALLTQLFRAYTIELIQNCPRCLVEAADAIIFSHQLPKASRFRFFLFIKLLKMRTGFLAIAVFLALSACGDNFGAESSREKLESIHD